MPTTDRKLRVFICHSSQDKPIVRELYQRLLAEGWIDPWLDEEKLLPGQDWDIEIANAVEVADAVIVCISNNSITKEGYVQKEIKKILDISDQKPEETIFIIPLRLEECEPPRRISPKQYTDYFPVEYKEKGFKRLVSSLNMRAEHIKNSIDQQKRVEIDAGKDDKMQEQMKHGDSTIPTLLDWAAFEQERGDPYRVRELYEEAAKVDPSDVSIWKAWAAFEQKRGDPFRVRELYEMAVKINPRDASIWRDWAAFEQKRGDPFRVRELYEMAVKINPRDASIWRDWAAFEKERGDPYRARELYEMALKTSRG